MQALLNNYKTDRLLLNELNLNDAEFIFALVNTPGWIEFIGDRNVKTIEDSQAYVKKIIDDPNIFYWVVKLEDQQTPIGIITFIKRNYLDHHDIGFAFLPQYAKHGYAYEATVALLNKIAEDKNHTKILATTIPENKNSTRLLEKLGFCFEKNIKNENDKLLLYSITSDKIGIDNLTKTFFSIFTNTNGKNPDWSIINSICLPETVIIKKTDLSEIIYSKHTFIEPRKIILTDGTLTDFEEHEIQEETKIIGHIAQRFSKYQKSGYLNGNYFKGYGTKFFQFINTRSGWKINSLIWEDSKTELE
jgi:RimJ/RimL family protein N-acetyltransferase